jgi:hypothetical protein
MKPILFGPSVVAVIFLLAGCGGGDEGSSASTTTSEDSTASTTEPTVSTTGGEVAEVGLTPNNGSGTNGTATFTDVAQGVQVDLDVQGLPDPNASYLTHIHPGTCADEQGGEQHDSNHEDAHVDHEEGTKAEIEYPLPPITPDPEGRGTTTAMLEGVTVEQLFSGSPKYVNVHAEGSGDPPAIACSSLSR